MKKIEINIQEPYFGFILSGKKTVEGRLNKGKSKEIEIGGILNINNEVEFEVVGKRIYSSFREMIEKEGIEKTIPDKKSVEEAVGVYRRFYTLEEENKFGVVAIEIARSRE